jgi:hypothetical protein
MKTSRTLPRTAIVAGAVTVMLAAGTGTALAATSKGNPSPTPAAGYTQETYVKNGRTVTEYVPTASLGLASSSSGLTLGDKCVLGLSEFTGLGVLAAEANDGASVKDLFLSSLEGFFAPYYHPDCIAWLRQHHVP